MTDLAGRNLKTFAGPTLFRFGCVIADAAEPIDLARVTGRDRTGAIQADPEHCPIARSLKRTLRAVEVHVYNSNVYIITHPPQNYDSTKALNRQPEGFVPGRGIRGVLSSQDKQKLKSFDMSNGGFFPLGAVVVMPPPPSSRIGARKGTKAGSNTRNGVTKNVYRTPSTRAIAGSYAGKTA